MQGLLNLGLLLLEYNIPKSNAGKEREYEKE